MSKPSRTKSRQGGSLDAAAQIGVAEVQEILALGGLRAFVVPAAAKSNHGSCATAPAIASDTINLETIPVLNTPGPKSVKGAADDECVGSRSVPGDRTEQEFGDSDD